MNKNKLGKAQLNRLVKKEEAKIKTPYVLERFMAEFPHLNTGRRGDLYYFRIIRRRGGKIVLDSGEGYSTKQGRTRAIITLLNSLFRTENITIIDK